ncbi:histidine phosphotransferase ChpT [Roseovarius azorensis]|uniref:Histidine phosphotransferase ChpT n=1 Tax=Roseovarius azorensis TaxID=1287727 RepID=A0A1H7VA79_9RHOB|nr:histidine phosphotransferase family protein [Roseovarius azorensis]SEM05838.1 histidine phosphotransferase ChpT [Roseovarius azorensis]
MPQDRLTLATLTGSRICHDLASPLGSVVNGLELLELSGMRDSPELALIRESIAGARATLELQRLAFGNPSSDHGLGTEVLHQILVAHYRARPRLTVEWFAQGTISRVMTQILLLAVLAAEQALPRGGMLTIRQTGKTWQIIARGESVSPDMTLWEAMEGRAPMPSPDPRTCHFFILKECLEANNSFISITRDEAEFRLML